MDILREEMKGLLTRDLPIEKFKNKTFLVTGATGLIGSLLVKSLLFLDNEKALNLKVLAGIRDQVKADKMYKGYNGSLQYINLNLGKGSIICEDSIDFIIHAASVTTSKYMVTNPVETLETAVNGTKELLQLAVDKTVSGMVYVSSMEVYGQLAINNKVTEKDLGYIDLTRTRSCYPEGKRMCEMLCTAYASEYGVQVKTARLAQVFGVGVLPTENRVFVQFAHSAMKRQDIVLHTTGESEGNYVYTFDAVVGLLLLLTEGEAGEFYNISNEESHTTIKGMAEMVAEKIAGGNVKVIIDIPECSMGYASDVKLWLDSSKIRKLGWKPTVGLEESYRRMIQWMNLSI